MLAMLTKHQIPECMHAPMLEFTPAEFGLVATSLDDLSNFISENLVFSGTAFFGFDNSSGSHVVAGVPRFVGSRGRVIKCSFCGECECRFWLVGGFSKEVVFG